MNPLFFMGLADNAKCLSNCRANKFGCVITNDLGNTVFIGYNTDNSDAPLCICERCERRQKGLIKSTEELETCRCGHAEDHALIAYAESGSDDPEEDWQRVDWHLFTQMLPCEYCTEDILSYDFIKSINIYDDYYAYDDKRNTEIKEKFKKRGIEINYINNSEVLNYKWKCRF